MGETYFNGGVKLFQVLQIIEWIPECRVTLVFIFSIDKKSKPEDSFRTSKIKIEVFLQNKQEKC